MYEGKTISAAKLSSQTIGENITELAFERTSLYILESDVRETGISLCPLLGIHTYKLSWGFNKMKYIILPVVYY